MSDRGEARPLAGQAALVTGGGGGIGRAIALALAGAGADVVIADIVPERCDEAADRVRDLGGRALPCPTDVRSTDQVRAVLAAADDRFGRLDILVNNAGGVAKKAFVDQSERSWRNHIDINFVSVLAASSAAVPLMVRGGRGGAILNVSSIEAARAAPGYAIYAACKAAMNSLTRTLAVELAEHGIRVNAIAPDLTVTPGLRGNVTGPVDESAWFQPSAEQEAAVARYIPLGRAGRAEECGAAALFLCSPAAGYITGITLPVDGGTWASSGWSRNRGDGGWVLMEP